MRKTDFEFKYLGSCPVCGSSFQGRQTEILNRREGLSQVYAQCSECKSSIVIFVLRNAIGFITTIGMLTDMTKKDILRFGKMEPLTSDDVLELHQMLEEEN